MNFFTIFIFFLDVPVFQRCIVDINQAANNKRIKEHKNYHNRDRKTQGLEYVLTAQLSD